MKNWKAGDWCFYEFELGLVKEVRKGECYSIGTGVIETSGKLGDRMFPLDYRILQISQQFQYWDDRLRRETETFNLNWPDINWWLSDRWATTCNNKNDEKFIEASYGELAKFCQDIIEGCKDMRHKTVGGINAFSRR